MECEKFRSFSIMKSLDRESRITGNEVFQGGKSMRRKGVSLLLAAVMAAALVFSGCGKDASVSGQGSGASQGSEAVPGEEGAAGTGEAAAESGGTDKGGTGEVTTVDYVFWGNQTEINTIMKTIDAFNASHTDIQVKGTGIDPSVYLQKLSAYASSNTLPDIVQVAVDYGDEYTKKGMFEPLDGMIESAGLKDMVGDNLWQELSYDGQIYAVPLQASACLMVGNKQLFEEAGVEFPTDSWTEEEFREAAVKMTDAEKKQYGVIYAGSIIEWPRALYGNGSTQIYDWDAKQMNAVGNDALKHAWDLLIDDLMLTEKAAPAVMSSKDIGGGFETGKYGMAFIGFWDIAEIHKVVQDSFEWDLIPLPISEEYGQWRTPMYANALSISANSEKKEAAFEYIKWTLENRDIQTSSVSLPVNKSIAEDPEFLSEFQEGTKNYNKQLALDALANSVSWRNTGVIAEINNNVIKTEIERLILKPDSTDLDTVLQNMQTEGQKLFDAQKD